MTTESGKSNSGSRWHRPNLYVTIVSLYLLVSVAIVILLAIESLDIWGKSLPVGDSKVGLAGIFLIPAGGILLIWSIISIIGSVKLFQLHWSGFWISLAAVLSSLVILPSSVILFENVMYDASAALINTPIISVINSLTIIVPVTMIPLLLIGRKRIQWK
jgi:hypothetical protein